MSDRIQIIQGDALTVLKTLPSESVHCVVTSPPYWGLRDYGTAQWEGGDAECDHKSNRQVRGAIPGTKQATNNQGEGGADWQICGKCGAKRIDQQLGLERTPEEYVAKMVEVFREVRRVLREDGTAWVNMGDAYANTATGPHKTERDPRAMQNNSGWTSREQGTANTLAPGLKPKDLCGIPWRLAFALQADGWWLRQDIIWHKPNPMPESVTDRCTKAHEYVFLLTKAERYFFDAEAIKERAETEPHSSGHLNGAEYAVGPMDRGGHSQREDPDRVWAQYGRRNRRSVWTIPSEPYPESHFATFPTALVKPCILAGTSARGACPKCGSPWERVVEPTTEYSNLIGHSYHDHKADGKEYAIRQQGKGPMSGDQTAKACPNGKYTTTGWRPTCQHGEDPSETRSPIPCTVLDPFGGSGTVGQVALELGRKAILVELNPAYVELARKRTNVTSGLQLA